MNAVRYRGPVVEQLQALRMLIKPPARRSQVDSRQQQRVRPSGKYSTRTLFELGIIPDILLHPRRAGVPVVAGRRVGVERKHLRASVSELTKVLFFRSIRLKTGGQDGSAVDSESRHTSHDLDTSDRSARFRRVRVRAGRRSSESRCREDDSRQESPPIENGRFLMHRLE